MTAFVLALLTSASLVAAVTIVLLVASRVWRRTDATLWHQAWTAVAAASLLMPVVAAAWPMSVHVLQLSAAGPSTTNAAWRAVVLDRAAAIVAAIYGVGVAVAVIRLVAGLCIVGRLVARSTMPEGLPADRLQESIGVAALRCRVHQRLQVPITVGWIEPLVLLPPTWILWEAARRDAVVRHELAHTARRDYVWNLLAAIQHAVYWFSPAAWIVARRIRLTAELACDQQAATMVGAGTYARVLVETARDATRHGARAGILAVSAITELEARVEALAAATPTGSASSRGLRIGLVAIVVLVLAGASTIRVVFGAAAEDNGGFSADHRAAHQALHGAEHRH